MELIRKTNVERSLEHDYSPLTGTVEKTQAGNNRYSHLKWEQCYKVFEDSPALSQASQVSKHY